MKTVQLPIQEITKGCVVQAADGDWWRVTATDVDLDTGTVVLTTRHTGDGRKGWIQGAVGDQRTVRR
ncbi:hypothetical protein H4696_009776 [Amycolatopsis lexingtonensis]|uniref:Uncharacterized protein n=1 Tax=Amycolatopsis lexingtonensis TaxID=218822 RepID=A0ABR9IHL6_9PSEU|nr:hypothetical protein [Amycolatopsis lexingtonensis]MBE1502676.1 hypothetical protein [Amycolatopsis lexingtonensis]